MVEDAQPMILNMLDLTPEVNAIVYAYPADSYELDSLELCCRSWPGLGPRVTAFPVRLPAYRGAGLSPVEALRYE